MHSDDLKLPLDQKHPSTYQNPTTVDQKHPSTYQNPTSVDQNFYSFDEKLSTNCSDLDERVLILHYQSQPILGISTKKIFL